jgi:tetratricopeptide (TPR) repeat protein
MPIPGGQARALALAALLACAAPVLADDAEIISLVGKGDTRESAQAQWQPAAVKTKLQGGWFARTREQSQMALMLRDRSVVRLSQLSILNIKGMGPPTTRVALPQGRAWASSKQPAPEVAKVRATPILEVETPAGIAYVRGTDWEIAVEPDGSALVTVLSGEVELANEQGRVSVGPNEQGRAAPGRAPVKTLLSSAAERVQWVTSYRPQPRRWVPQMPAGLEPAARAIEAQEFAQALALLSRERSAQAALLHADLQLFLGEAERAIALLEPHAGDPMAAALLARAYMISGRFDDAQHTLDRHSANAEILLAKGELARLRGDPAATLQAAQEVLKLEPRNAEAWYVIGRVHAEREYARAAREALARAIELGPEQAAYRAELGTLETFANEFGAAERALAAALERAPDDYVALTGLGVLQLKRGDAGAALESFLKAGVMEPRYARAALFAGVAQYQLGNRARALEAFDKAAALDDKDPLPHLVKSLAYFDALELGRAIEAAREAQARMANLKSLNQLLSDQKGNANVGSALAAFGLEEWAQAYAYDAYSPYWAGSPLFLADRFSGTFNKNSELFKGFLSDPAVFGASNRWSSIVPVPGNYGMVEAFARRDFIDEAGVGATLNGYRVTPVPVSYVGAVEKTHGDSRMNTRDADGRMEADGDNLVLGLGLKPTHELALFGFANASNLEGTIADAASGLTDDRFSVDRRRFDVGANYKFSPTNHAWLKVGAGTEDLPVSGALRSQDVADSLNTAFGTTVFGPDGRLNRFRSEQEQRDVQWRHTFDAGADTQLSWGLEYARAEKPISMELEFLPVRLRLDHDNRLESRSAWASGRVRLSGTLEAQLDAHYQDTESSFRTRQELEVVPGGTLPLPTSEGTTERQEINPRAGIKWRPSGGHTVRLAGQVWRKPAGVGTLAPLDTVGIAVDDRVVAAGGRLSRGRLQHEIELGRATFLQWFADAKHVHNLDDPGSALARDLQLDQLERLRVRRRTYAVPLDYFEDTPQFGEGDIASFGAAANRLLTPRTALAARYVYAKSKNTGEGFGGSPLPYHPRHYLNATLTWQPWARTVLGAATTYRSHRFTDEDNETRLDAGWNLGLQAYWESDDKRVSLGALIDQVVSKRSASLYRRPLAQLQGAYRF